MYVLLAADAVPTNMYPQMTPRDPLPMVYQSWSSHAVHFETDVAFRRPWRISVRLLVASNVIAQRVPSPVRLVFSMPRRVWGKKGVVGSHCVTTKKVKGAKKEGEGWDYMWIGGGLTEESEHATGKNGVLRCCFRCVLTSLPVSLEKRSPRRMRARRKEAAERSSIAELFSGVPSTTWSPPLLSFLFVYLHPFLGFADLWPGTSLLSLPYVSSFQEIGGFVSKN